MVSDLRREREDTLKGLRKAAWPDKLQGIWVPNISKCKEKYASFPVSFLR